jgi:hypothetical protein
MKNSVRQRDVGPSKAIQEFACKPLYLFKRRQVHRAGHGQLSSSFCTLKMQLGSQRMLLALYTRTSSSMQDGGDHPGKQLAFQQHLTLGAVDPRGMKALFCP